MCKAVIDTSVLVAFSGIKRIDLILGIFPEIDIVPAVFNEVVIEGEGWLNALDAQDAIHAGKLQVVPKLQAMVPPELVHLGKGEREVITLALDLGIPALIDDGPARTAAERVGVREIIGSLGVLRRAKQLGKIKASKPFVLGMRANGIRFSDEIIGKFFSAMGEG